MSEVTPGTGNPVKRLFTALMSKSAIRYLFAGGIAFLVDFGILALLREVLGWPTWLAAGTAFVLSFAFSYTIQRIFSFQSTAGHGTALVKYTTLVIFNTLATSLIVAFLDNMGAGWAIGKVAATAATTIWNYFAYRYWVFADTRTETAQPERTPSDV